MTVSTVYGWTTGQIAIAAGVYLAKYGTLPAESASGLIDIRATWTSPFEPGKSPIIGIDTPTPETAYAAKTFYNIAIESRTAA